MCPAFAGLEDLAAAEAVKSRDLGKELADARHALESESRATRLSAMRLRCSTRSLQSCKKWWGGSSLSALFALVSDRVRELEREAVVSGISRAFAITLSHYGETIDLKGINEGYAPGYIDEELSAMEASVEPAALALTRRLREEVMPQWGL